MHATFARCLSTHNGLMSNLSVIFTYGTKKTCQIAVARLIKNKTFSQVLFFVLPLVVGMFAKCHKRRNLHFCFVGEGNFAAPHSENLMTGVVYAKRLGVRVVVVQRFYMNTKVFSSSKYLYPSEVFPSATLPNLYALLLKKNMFSVA